jgi:hypothetical protein
MDRLQELEGCTDFAVGGICSAADVGWQAAVVDARVCGTAPARRHCLYRPMVPLRARHQSHASPAA